MALNDLERRVILWSSNLVSNPLEGELSIEGEFFLGQWNLNAASSSSSNATIRIGFDKLRLCDHLGSPVLSLGIE